MLKEETVLRALQAVQSYGRPVTAREFALRMWPTSPYWAEPSKLKRDGRETGAKMASAGGALLGRLQARGLVWRVSAGYWITAMGARFLQDRTAPPASAPVPPAGWWSGTA